MPRRDTLHMGSDAARPDDGSAVPIGYECPPVEAVAYDREPSQEVVLGAYEYVPFNPGQLVSLSQIRGERNVVTDELKEDILFQGLINPVDVSLVSRQLLEEYIAFTNDTWGSEASIDDYSHLQLSDGRFPLLKSGHSRAAAVMELIAEGKLPANTQIMTKVKESHNVFEIVQWQRGENIHSQPPRERTAMALVESYMYGLNSGLWSNEAEFIAIQHQQGRSVAKGPLTQALKYAKLAPRIRNFVLAGEVPYLAGVEMGATMDTLAEYIARTNGYQGVDDPRLTANPERMKMVRQLIEIEMDRICNRITGDNLNSTASQKVVQAKRSAWADANKSMREPRRKGSETTLHFEFADDALEKAVLAAQRALKRELTDTKNKYAGHNIPRMLRLQEGILPQKDVIELIEMYEEEIRKTQQTIGAFTTTASAYDTDLFG